MLHSDQLKELPSIDLPAFEENDLSEEEMDSIHVRQQGTFFGYASSQTPSLMPMPIMLAHKLAMRLDFVRRRRIIPYLAPDGKTQVGVECLDRKPARIYSLGIAVSKLSGSMKAPHKITNDIQQAVIGPGF